MTSGEAFTGPYEINVPALYRHVNTQRNGAAWLTLAHGLGLSSSVFTRMAAGTPPSANALVTLLVWLLSRGIQPRQYIRPTEPKDTP